MRGPRASRLSTIIIIMIMICFYDYDYCCYSYYVVTALVSVSLLLLRFDDFLVPLFFAALFFFLFYSVTLPLAFSGFCYNVINSNKIQIVNYIYKM